MVLEILEVALEILSVVLEILSVALKIKKVWSTFSLSYVAYCAEVFLCLGMYVLLCEYQEQFDKCGVKQQKALHEILACLKGLSPKKLR